jgi:hypothetical protein
MDVFKNFQLKNMLYDVLYNLISDPLLKQIFQ